VKIACTRGCSFCCSLQVQVQPHETFTLAAWLRETLRPGALVRRDWRLRDNAAKTREMGDEARKRSNLVCAHLGDDGRGAPPTKRARAQCRRFHSTRLEVCKASYANPADDSCQSPRIPR
jgi:hypothetical protein